MCELHAVAADNLRFCCIECARAHGAEPNRLLTIRERIGDCAGCGFPLSPSLPDSVNIHETIDNDLEVNAWTAPRRIFRVLSP